SLDPAQLELRNGNIYQKGIRDPVLDLKNVLAHVRETVRVNPGEPALEETAYFNSNQLTHSYGVHLAHVAVDPETGVVEIIRYMGWWRMAAAASTRFWCMVRRSGLRFKASVEPSLKSWSTGRMASSSARRSEITFFRRARMSRRSKPSFWKRRRRR